MITIQHIKTEVFNHFIDGDTYLKIPEFVNIIKEIYPVKEFSEQQLFNIVHSALTSLGDICTNVGENTFILTKPINTYSQSLEISGELATNVASLINTMAAKINGNEKILISDPLNIVDKDIETLFLLAENTLKNYPQNETQESDDDDDDNGIIPGFLQG